MAPLTELLNAATDGDAKASSRLFEEVYADLKRMAHRRLYQDGRVEGVDTTVLVHESFLRMVEHGQLRSDDRAAFFGYVGRVMRSVLVDHVREQRAAKRGGNQVFVTLTTGIAAESFDDERLLAIDAALGTLERLAPELHRLVDMRYFAGLSVLEVAELRGISTRSVEREWDKARAFLRKLIEEG
jgi:RNA polymerase sigma factor (TIGR02999 family)